MPDNRVVEEAPLEKRLRDFRRSFWQATGTLVFLIGLNVLTTPSVPWALIAAIVFAIGLIRQAAALWADGVSWKELFSRDPASLEPRQLRGDSVRALPGRWGRGNRNAGAHRAIQAPESARGGATARAMARAREHHATIVETMRQLSTSDRQLIPDVRPTVDALLEQALVLGDSLCRLDESIGAESVDEVGSRIAALDRESAHTAEWERRRELLERQQTSINELRQRQTDLRERFERSTLLLENLRLDMLKLRSAGVESAAEDVAGATQQARALSRDIRHALDAAAEVKAIR